MADSHLEASPSAPFPNNIEGNATMQQNRSTLRNGGSNIRVIVCFLDLSNSIYPIPCKTLGKTLFYNVCESLNLIEVDYFGLMYFDSKNNQYWLDHEKPLNNQLELNGKSNVTMHFAVKFYTTEPSKLEDELTRYLFALQIKKDLADGSLICNENVTAMLCAFTVQAECGDYNCEYPNHFYISRLKLIPQQDTEFELKVFANHQKLIGLSPAEADMQLLELASSQEMFGIHLSPVKDHEGVPLNLAVIHHGILIFQNYTKVNSFDWALIRKLSFKRKHLYIKLHHEEFFGDVLEFVFQHRNECKNFWKKCIEQHSFFKCFEVQSKSRQKLRIFSRGSSFRYAGRTQQQLSEFIKSNNIHKQKTFQRSSSMKLNPGKEDECTAYGCDYNYNGSRKDNLDSTSCKNIAVQQQIYKSCDTIDHESVQLNGSSVNGDFSHNNTTDGFQNMKHLSNINLQSTLDFRGFKRRLSEDYYIFRDIVNCERTFLKDLELMRNWFENQVSKETSRCSEMLSLLLSVSEPLIECHKFFLIDVEQLLWIWDKEGIESLPPLSKILNKIHLWLGHYEQYIERLPFTLEQVNSSFDQNKEFEGICREFEAKKGCYMPYSSFLLKPAFHITFYSTMIQKIIDCYCANNCDYINLKRLVEQLNSFNFEYSNTFESLINLVILIELQRDIAGLDNIVQSGRRFIREGCLLKLSKKGFQQRLFFLFSDILIYASKRNENVGHGFKIHGYFSLYNIYIEETEPKYDTENCFTIFAGDDKVILLAAMSEKDRQAWIYDIKEAVSAMSLKPDFVQTALVTNDLLEKIDSALNEHWKPQCPLGSSLEFDQLATTNLQLRTNTIVNVCWQRAATISYNNYKYALTISFGSYLLRKFKNCSGWQKLWVEFSHFCMFFYKNSDDDYPLASLPVLDYTVSLPVEADQMSKNFVFKLQFKAHVYFFRAESEYSFKKWQEVLANTSGPH